MHTDFKIEWDGPRSRYHEARVREEAARQARLCGDPTYPRGCSYLRVPLVPQDHEGPGIDCHWDEDRHVLVCYMDLEDGPLPAELEALVNPHGDAVEELAGMPAAEARPKRLN
ncbi:MAG: hypothetical protein AB3N15_11050 [Paracoccaceae bacterium]